MPVTFVCCMPWQLVPPRGSARATSFVPIVNEVGMEIARPVEEKPEAEADQYSLVPTTTVDQLLASQGLQAVDLCLIDTEGHDHAVLRGAENALRTHSLKIVTFEYGGLWCFRQPNNACIRLEPLIAFLANFAYSCWWLGNDGDVARIDPTCEDVSTRRWSNIGCMAREISVITLETREITQKVNHGPTSLRGRGKGPAAAQR